MTRYEIALKFAEILGLPTDHLVKVDTWDENVSVKRPLDAQMDVGRLKDLGINLRTVDFEGWWRRHLRVYRH